MTMKKRLIISTFIICVGTWLIFSIIILIKIMGDDINFIRVGA